MRFERFGRKAALEELCAPGWRRGASGLMLDFRAKPTPHSLIPWVAAHPDFYVTEHGNAAPAHGAIRIPAGPTRFSSTSQSCVQPRRRRNSWRFAGQCDGCVARKSYSPCITTWSNHARARQTFLLAVAQSTPFRRNQFRAGEAQDQSLLLLARGLPASIAYRYPPGIIMKFNA